MKTVARGHRQRNILLTISALLISAAGVCAQTDTSAGSGNAGPASPTSTNSGSANTAGGPSPAVASSAPVMASSMVTEADALQRRMERARALAASHQLIAAATELESIRASAKDEVSRNVSSLMLMGIYLEDGNYARAESMLEETFKQRSSKNESSVRTYFALAGQAVNGARAHVARYRTFGINVSSTALPAEATADLDRLRSLLERMTAQSKELLKQNAKDNDGFALLEDLSGIRTALARDAEDRARWQNEYSAARARLATLPTEIASLSGIPALPGGSDLSATRSVQANVESSGGSDSTSQSSASERTASSLIPNSPSVSTSMIDNHVGSSPSTMDVGSLIEKATKKVIPAYPQTAKNVGISGLVRVKVVIDESGSVASVVWTEGPVTLRQAAQDAVRQWKFQPVVVDGKPVKATGYIDFGFSR